VTLSVSVACYIFLGEFPRVSLYLAQAVNLAIPFDDVVNNVSKQNFVRQYRADVFIVFGLSSDNTPTSKAESYSGHWYRWFTHG
jgi:hypothetical protein